MPIDPGTDGSYGRVFKTYVAKLIVKYNKLYSDVSNVPSSGSDSDSIISDTTNNGSVWLGVGVSSTIPTRTGYDFVGWRESATNSSSALVSPGSNIARKVSYGSTVTVNLYPWFSVKTNKITYYANGGSGAPAAQTKNYGETVNISASAPTRTGYIFLRWNTNSSGTGTNYTAGQAYSTNADLNLYAVWKQAASVPTVNKTSVNIGDSITINTNRVDSSATHKLTYSLEKTDGQKMTGDIPSDGSSVGESCTWTIPANNSFYEALSTRVSAVLTIKCKTYVGNVQSGDEQSVTITIKVPSDIRPTLSVSTSVINDSDVDSILGSSIVQGFSSIRFTLSSTPGTGATFSSFTISGPDLPNDITTTETPTTIDTSMLTTSGALQWSIYATDSRGRTSAVRTITKTVVAYSRPSISPIAMNRCDSNGNVDPYTGTYLTSRSFYSAQNVGSNTITSAKVYYRLSSADSSSWTLGVDLTSATDFGSGQWTPAFGGGNLAPEYSYEVKYEIQDSIGEAKHKSASTVTSYPIPSSAGFSYGIYNDRLRLGGLVEEPGLVVDWAAKFKNAVTIQNLNNLGIIGTIVGEGDNISLLLTGNK